MERILEDAIRSKAKRFLLVATPHGVQKQGVRNEIAIANETGKRLKEDGFIVPLRLHAYDKPLQIPHTQYINFEKSWAEGLAELVALLEEVGVPKSAPSDEAQTWQSLQLERLWLYEFGKIRSEWELARHGMRLATSRASDA